MLTRRQNQVLVVDQGLSHTAPKTTAIQHTTMERMMMLRSFDSLQDSGTATKLMKGLTPSLSRDLRTARKEDIREEKKLGVFCLLCVEPDEEVRILSHLML